LFHTNSKISSAQQQLQI